MKANFGKFQKLSTCITLAIGLTAASVPINALAAPGDLNSTNTGRDVAGGTYFNTAGSRTTFVNPNGGLWVHSGVLVRGLESDASKIPTGNGGSLYFRAPGNIVRLDGNIDVSAVRNGTAYTGNGGRLFVDSGYLFQSGNVYANGANGGLVQFNVGGMTLGSNAQITAQGFGGNGGSININSPGTVDIRTGAIIDTSGKVAGTFDTNVINIEGSAINNQGVIRANGAFGQDLKPDNGDAAVMTANPQLANNPVPPPISAGSGNHDTATMSNILFGTPGNADFRGGVIRLVASGQNQATDGVVNNADSQILTSTEKSDLNTRNNLIVSNNNGDVFNRGSLISDGTLGKNGGTIILASARHIINSATIRALGSSGPDGIFSPNGSGANGGNGGTIVLTARNTINNVGNIQANGGAGARANSVSASGGNGKDTTATVTGTPGSGGQGGLLAFSYGSMSNTGSIQANGAQGGIGGHANSFDTEGATASNPNPVARATSNAGTGGAGGQGGLIVFSGNANATGGGAVQANGGQGGRGGNAWADSQAASNIGIPSAISVANKGAGGAGGQSGTVITPISGTFASTQVFSAKSGGSGDSGSASFRQITTSNGVSTTTTGSSPVTTGSATTGDNRAALDTHRNEYLRNDDTAILLSQAGGTGTDQNTLTGRLTDAGVIRTISNPAGSTNDRLADVESAANFVIGSTSNQALNLNLVNSNINPLFFNLNTLTIQNNADLTNGTLWTPGVHLVGAGFHDLTLSLGGGHISWLANGSISNNQIVMTRGLWTGGGIHLAATQDITNNSDFITIAPFKELLSGFTLSGPKYESSHAGSLTFKAGRDFSNTSNGKISSNLIFFDIHPPLNQNPPIDWPKFLNGAQMGASVNMFAGRNLTNSGLIAADALTYRNGLLGSQNPSFAIGGIVVGRHGTGTFTNTGTIQANGNAFFSPNETDGARFNTNTFPATTSFSGNVDVN